MGGATISFKSMIEGVVKEDVKPIIVYPRKEYNDTICVFEKMGIKCIPCFITSSVISKNATLKTILSLSKQIIHKILSFINLLIICSKIKPDIIHTNTGVVHEGFFISRLLQIPHVWHIREYQTLDFNWTILPSKKKFIKELYKSYTVFITKDLQKCFKQDNQNTSSVIYNPIYDFEEVNNLSQIKQKYFLIANRISKEKGIEDIINGYAKFIKINSEYVLKIAGFGNEQYINELHTLCEKLNVSNNVEFLGYVSDMRTLISNAEILFVGSYFEAFGRMTAEANMLKTFVIGRNTGGTKEVIELTHGGSLFDNEKEIPSLLESWIKMSTDGKEQIICAAQKLAFEYFSKQRHSKEVIQLYMSILSDDKVC